ncbi:MAG: AbrB/MazE/SpoVT family DNA-binding domain-containing protein [Candidatus Woesearchaeota archaeon]
MKKNKTCSNCQNKMIELKSKTPEGIAYIYYKCQNCGEEILDMAQLNKVATEYRKIKRFNAKLTKWGYNLGVRIPKELIKKYNFKDNVIIIPENEGIKIILN